jgi:hypothetical protein
MTTLRDAKVLGFATSIEATALTEVVARSKVTDVEATVLAET